MEKQLTQEQTIKNTIATTIIKNIEPDFDSFTPEAQEEIINNVYNDMKHLFTAK
jgi:hypothetical protein